MSTLSEIPADIAAELEAQSKDLNPKIPPKKFEKNILIATGNIRAFSDLTKER